MKVCSIYNIGFEEKQTFTYSLKTEQSFALRLRTSDSVAVSLFSFPSPSFVSYDSMVKISFRRGVFH